MPRAQETSTLPTVSAPVSVDAPQRTDATLVAPTSTAQTTALLPTPTSAPTETPIPQQVITIDAPAANATLSSPFDLAGRIAFTPPDKRLIYTLTDINGALITSGTLQVVGTPGEQGMYSATVPFAQAQPGSALVRVIAIDGSVSVAVQIPEVTAQFQEGIRFRLNGVATTARAEIGPAYINQKTYIDMDALPEHLRILFDADVAGKGFDPRARQLLIVPFADYRAMFGGQYTAQFANAMGTLQGIVFSRTLPADAILRVLPAHDQTMQFQAQQQVLLFANGAGVRFVTQFTQEITPVTASSLTYVFQGLTSDGAFFVAGFFPITSTTLPADASQITQDERDMLKRDYTGYISGVVQRLNSDPQQLTPSLIALDALVTSLTISQNPLARQEPTPAPPSSTAAAAQAATATTTGRSTELLNIRATASTRGRVLGRVQVDETVTLIGRTANSQWLRIRTGAGVVGWVSRAYIETPNNVEILPIIE